MKALKYSDISLIPKYSEVHSRSDCDTSIRISNHHFKLPIIPANMKSVINADIAKWMSENDYFYIMHRFDVDNFEFVKKANQENWKTISISMGAKLKDKANILKISEAKLKVDFITIDIAHGHSKRVKIAIEHIKKYMPNTIIIAGNVATLMPLSTLLIGVLTLLRLELGRDLLALPRIRLDLLFQCLLA